MSITAITAKAAKPKERPYKLADEKGMFLLVNPNGSKYWRLKYRFVGKEKTLALGVFPEVSLAEARGGRDEARAQLRSGVDPGAVKRLKKAQRFRDVTASFRVISEEWYQTRLADKSESYRDRSWRLLKNDLFPALGARPINQITAPELLMALRKVESRGAVDMAHRARQTAGQVFRFAIATGRAERDPSGDLKGALKPRNKKHYASITDPNAVAKLLVAMDAYDGGVVVKVALQLSALLFQRPGEIRAMEWGEIKWGSKQWEIPATKMKMGEPHIVPLATQSIELLKEIEPVTAHRGKYVFPSQRGASRPLSDNGVRTALRTLGYGKDAMTAHGFRAMARTLLDEELKFRVDYIEHQLAHAVRDANGRAYNRTRHLEERHKMMQAWADYLYELKLQSGEDNVVTARFGETSQPR